jgi:hypothetical protein
MLLCTGFYLAWHLCCPRSVYSMALYWRCDGYILPLWHCPITGFAALAGLYMVWLFPSAALGLYNHWLLAGAVLVLRWLYACSGSCLVLPWPLPSAALAGYFNSLGSCWLQSAGLDPGSTWALPWLHTGMSLTSGRPCSAACWAPLSRRTCLILNSG